MHDTGLGHCSIALTSGQSFFIPPPPGWIRVSGFFFFLVPYPIGFLPGKGLIPLSWAAQGSLEAPIDISLWQRLRTQKTLFPPLSQASIGPAGDRWTVICAVMTHTNKSIEGQHLQAFRTESASKLAVFGVPNANVSLPQRLGCNSEMCLCGCKGG